MRVDSLTLVACLALVGGIFLPMASTLNAQEAGRDVSAGPETPVIDEVKLIAQRAAMGSLTGKTPFVLRESSWSGVIEPGKARLIQLQLFKRNEYQFWMAVPNRKAGVNVNVYDGNGEIVESENIRYDTGNVASLIVRPRETGVYYLRISLQTSIETSQKWSVIYAYR